MCCEGSRDSGRVRKPRLAYGRIQEHPILGPLRQGETCSVWVDSRLISAREGEPVLAAMLAAGLVVMRWTEKRGTPRGLFCGIGLCTDCMVTIDGTPNVRSCITPARDGMRIETGKGEHDAS